MSEEILMNVTPIESRVALVENGVVQEIFVERERSLGIAGNIYLGKVVRILPGMQAAFIDIGIDKASFIHASDISPDSVKNDVDEESDISQLLREGQTLLVQVVKDPIGSKGARVTSYLSVSSRNLVYMPFSEHIGVSQKIDATDQREQFKETLKANLLQETGDVELAGGFIIRTAAESLGDEGFLPDVKYLKRLWAALLKKIDARNAPDLIYEELHLCERVMRDWIYSGLEKVRVDDEKIFSRLLKFSEKFIPEMNERLELYSNDRPIFDIFGIEDELVKALGRKVNLKSGGHLVIDQTEAMTTVDVNTGAFVGRRNLDDTIFKTNLEASTALARQLRIRNLGGIIIVDFIDMQDEEHRRQVLRTLEKALAKDRAKSSFSDFSDLGLIQMTRKRTRESLEHILCESCHVCDGTGSIRSAETVCSEIFREIVREAKAYDNDKLLVLASQSVVDRLLDEDSSAVADLQDSLEKTIEFRVEPVYSQEQFDVILL